MRSSKDLNRDYNGGWGPYRGVLEFKRSSKDLDRDYNGGQDLTEEYLNLKGVVRT